MTEFDHERALRGMSHIVLLKVAIKQAVRIDSLEAALRRIDALPSYPVNWQVVANIVDATSDTPMGLEDDRAGEDQ